RLRQQPFERPLLPGEALLVFDQADFVAPASPLEVIFQEQARGVRVTGRIGGPPAQQRAGRGGPACCPAAALLVEQLPLAGSQSREVLGRNSAGIEGIPARVVESPRLGTRAA